MVKLFTQQENAELTRALQDAEKQTSAECAVVVVRASDEYRSAVLACGIALGSIIALVLWHLRLVTAFPQLLMIEIAICGLALAVPFLRHGCVKLVPRQVKHFHAKQRAATEYLHLVHHLPSSSPVLLLYVSLAERYVHIYTSRDVREKIPDSHWHDVVETLTASVQTYGLCNAVIKAVTYGAHMLKEHFPASAESHAHTNILEVMG